MLSRFQPFAVVESLRRVPRSAGVVAIIVASVAVVVLDAMDPAVGDALEFRSGVLGQYEFWRLFTYVFPHEGGGPHVALNMCLLGLYGWQLEHIVGTVRFLAIYFLGGALAMLVLSSFREISEATGLRSGASLAVFAVVAALIVVYIAAGQRRDAIAAAITMLVLLVLAGLTSMARRRIGAVGSAAPTGLEGVVFGIVNHAIGTGAGLLLGPVFARPRRLE